MMEILIIAIVSTACVSSRQMADPSDARLRTPDHDRGFAVQTRPSWRERIDPTSTLRFANERGEWSDRILADELRVDRNGAWTERGDHALVGWRWADVRNIEVAHLSGGRTFAAGLGVTVAAVTVVLVVVPIALLANRDGSSFEHIPDIDIDRSVAPRASWAPEPAGRDDLGARSLFTTGARVRSVALPMLAVDGAASLSGGMVETGALARLRIGGLLELGVGAREAATREETRWTRSITRVVQAGFHLALDADEHAALRLGVDISGGGEVHRDVRFPLGLGLTVGRWFATLNPATPAYLRTGHADGRWALVSGGELGVSF